MRTLRVALAQINTTVGDIDGNAAAIAAQIARARDAGADVVCFPELALTGYPPEDLLLRRQFVEDNLRALHDLLPHTQGITAVAAPRSTRSPARRSASTSARTSGIPAGRRWSRRWPAPR